MPFNTNKHSVIPPAKQPPCRQTGVHLVMYYAIMHVVASNAGTSPCGTGTSPCGTGKAGMNMRAHIALPTLEGNRNPMRQLVSNPTHSLGDHVRHARVG